MSSGHLIDSDIIIYHINDQLDEPAQRFVAEAFQGVVYISVISRMEILGWPGHSDVSWNITREFLGAFNEICLEEDVIQATIQLCRSIRIKLPDAIIAASALTHGLVLVTRNVEDFERIPGLQIVNPFNS